ncbi:MAG: diguanylate cyclase [Acidimicrobiia bacterium]
MAASVGIAIASHDTRNGDDVLAQADAATYEAKRRGKGWYVLFDEEDRITRAKARSPRGRVRNS